jgi:hypothetical protein
MPYFVYRKTPDGDVEFINEHANYRDAKSEVTDLRVNRSAEEEEHILRLIFAKDRREAKRLLTTKREISSPLQEWEEKL